MPWNLSYCNSILWTDRLILSIFQTEPVFYYFMSKDIECITNRLQFFIGKFTTRVFPAFL